MSLKVLEIMQQIRKFSEMYAMIMILLIVYSSETSSKSLWVLRTIRIFIMISRNLSKQNKMFYNFFTFIFMIVLLWKSFSIHQK